MKEQLEQIKGSALTAIAGAETEQALEEVRVRFLGKKGELTAILRGMGAVAPEDRPKIGAMVNTIRSEIEESLSARFGDLKAQSMERKLREERIDVTLPAPEKKVGKLHPITQTRNRMVEIFTGMGFEIAEGPEVESTYFNFDALNAPADHPSRDDTDTFYFSENVLLRTQTSPVQIRSMEGKIPPIRMISPGRVYRSDVADATHSPMFHQCEGLVIDKGITMGDLKGTLATFAKAMFGERTRIRFRPHNFPFTEPSAEVDVSCFVCGGKGCRLCKGEGWIEILGAGMVHPNVLRAGGIDPDVYSGFAFGMGIERVAMTMFGINDLRLMCENDARFLEQF
ncbi:MAG: phenylalanine--tRNA ligase subunit alpha [Ruminococcaceae bacterium]|nr:phenylalanine--tRNA ligase subunit alpha [Oscillospiraceae bacterium]MBQ8323687.1 phenylalanine--tRNA ligase subunit alpha [Clostridia bacterium]